MIKPSSENAIDDDSNDIKGTDTRATKYFGTGSGIDND